MRALSILLLFAFTVPASAAPQRCMPLDAAFDVETMPGGWNVMISKRSRQAVWIKAVRLDAGQLPHGGGVMICGAGQRWAVRR